MQTLTIQLHNRQQAMAALTAQLFPFLAAVLQADQRYTLTVKPQTRSSEQNRRLWAMLAEISKQVEWYGRKLSPEDWKHVLSASLKKQDAVPGIDGGFVVLGLSTSKMTKGEMADLQTLIEAFGAQKGVKFSAMERDE
jgi:NinB protein